MKKKVKALNQDIKRLVETKLWLKVIVSLFAGILLGITLGPDLHLVSPSSAENITSWLALPGNLFLQLIKMIIIPLVFCSISLGIVSSGDPAFLRKIGPRLVVYFIFTTACAITIGFIVSFLIKPGKFVRSESLSGLSEGIDTSDLPISGVSRNIPDLLVNLFPSNPLESMVNGDMLGVVVYTAIMGAALLSLNEKYKKPIVDLLQGIQELTMTVIRWAMELVPLAVFGLVCQITSQIGISALGGIGMYVLTVWLGLLLMVIIYNIVVAVFAKIHPKTFMKSIRDVQLLAFSTSSSAAVIPLSIQTAIDKFKIRPEIARFLIPVGATINMDGTALYQVVATIFLSQVFGVELSFVNLILITTITIGASIGAPSVPGVGIVILATILESVGIPGAGIALILGVDRILDMSRTMVNVTGDLTACCFFDRRLHHLFDGEEASK